MSNFLLFLWIQRYVHLLIFRVEDTASGLFFSVEILTILLCHYGNAFTEWTLITLSKCPKFIGVLGTWMEAKDLTSQVFTCVHTFIVGWKKNIIYFYYQRLYGFWKETKRILLRTCIKQALPPFMTRRQNR